VVLNEQPDSGSGNIRKKAKTAKNAPSNCLFVSGRCDAHQGHRTVELKERDVVGNVHAISVSCANPDFQNKLQLALKTIIDREILFMRGLVRKRLVAESPPSPRTCLFLQGAGFFFFSVFLNACLFVHSNTFCATWSMVWYVSSANGALD